MTVKMQQKITDDLDALLAVLPPDIEAVLREVNRGDELLEVVLDLGRQPEARFTDEEVIAIGGTGKGADTAVVLTPVNSQNFFDLKVKELSLIHI